MSQHYESLPTAESSPQNHQKYEYSKVVDAVRLSVARLLDIEGALQAHSFMEVLEDKSPEQQERIVCDVGVQFDQALIDFITVSLVAHPRRNIIIMTEEHEGVGEGHALPWKDRLDEHLSSLRNNGIINKQASVELRRYTANEIEPLTNQAKALAA